MCLISGGLLTEDRSVRFLANDLCEAGLRLRVNRTSVGTLSNSSPKSGMRARSGHTAKQIG